MDTHKFRIGESVYYKGKADGPSGVYVVLARLPQHEEGDIASGIRASLTN